jgi:hypothetical protein
LQGMKTLTLLIFYIGGSKCLRGPLTSLLLMLSTLAVSPGNRSLCCTTSPS